jgi:serine/threonine protein kinase
MSKIMEADAAAQRSVHSTQSPVNPRWLAPEVLQGQRSSAKTDVFAFGVVRGRARGARGQRCLRCLAECVQRI